jgi:hypothetical protein
VARSCLRMRAFDGNQQRWLRRLCLLLLVALTFAEYRFFQHRLHENRDEVGFVLANLDGILAGRPVWKSSQHRVLAPLVVSALERFSTTRAEALSWFMGFGLIAENALLWRLLRGREVSALVTLAVVSGFGFLHALTLYKLEYPWDWLDVPLFTVFGYWAATRARLVWLIPLLVLGAVNHETVLYLPLWYALAGSDPSLSAERRKREWLFASAVFATSSAGILFLREALYQGPANLPDRAPESGLRWLENPTHLQHNLRQLLWLNWGQGRAWLSLSLLGVVLVCAALIVRKKHARAALWSLLVLLSVACFGYVNETRLYLAPLAFWFGYASTLLPASPAANRSAPEPR